MADATEHLVKSFDSRAEAPARPAHGDGRAWWKARWRWRRGDPGARRRRRGARRSRTIPRSMRWSARSSSSSSACWRCASRWRSDLRQIVAALKITGDLERIGDYAANVAKRSIVLSQFHLAVLADRPRAHGAAGAGAPEDDHRCDRRERHRQGDRGLALRRGRRRYLQRAVPRADHLHDGRSAQHHAVHASAVHRQEPGADRRPRDQHRRDGLLRGEGRAADRQRGRRATRRPTPSCGHANRAIR